MTGLSQGSAQPTHLSYPIRSRQEEQEQEQESDELETPNSARSYLSNYSSLFSDGLANLEQSTIIASTQSNTVNKGKNGLGGIGIGKYFNSTSYSKNNSASSKNIFFGSSKHSSKKSSSQSSSNLNSISSSFTSPSLNSIATNTKNSSNFSTKINFLRPRSDGSTSTTITSNHSAQSSLSTNSNPSIERKESYSPLGSKPARILGLELISVNPALKFEEGFSVNDEGEGGNAKFGYGYNYGRKVGKRDGGKVGRGSSKERKEIQIPPTPKILPSEPHLQTTLSSVKLSRPESTSEILEISLPSAIPSLAYQNDYDAFDSNRSIYPTQLFTYTHDSIDRLEEEEKEENFLLDDSFGIRNRPFISSSSSKNPNTNSGSGNRGLKSKFSNSTLASTARSTSPFHEVQPSSSFPRSTFSTNSTSPRLRTPISISNSSSPSSNSNSSKTSTIKPLPYSTSPHLLQSHKSSQLSSTSNNYLGLSPTPTRVLARSSKDYSSSSPNSSSTFPNRREQVIILPPSSSQTPPSSNFSGSTTLIRSTTNSSTASSKTRRININEALDSLEGRGKFMSSRGRDEYERAEREFEFDSKEKEAEVGGKGKGEGGGKLGEGIELRKKKKRGSVRFDTKEVGKEMKTTKVGTVVEELEILEISFLDYQSDEEEDRKENERDDSPIDRTPFSISSTVIPEVLQSHPFKFPQTPQPSTPSTPSIESNSDSSSPKYSSEEEERFFPITPDLYDSDSYDYTIPSHLNLKFPSTPISAGGYLNSEEKDGVEYEVESHPYSSTVSSIGVRSSGMKEGEIRVKLPGSSLGRIRKESWI